MLAVTLCSVCHSIAEQAENTINFVLPWAPTRMGAKGRAADEGKLILTSGMRAHVKHKLHVALALFGRGSIER